MDSKLRASISAAVIAHSSGRQVASVYDHTAKEELVLQAHALGDRVACYDGTGDRHLAGALPNLSWSSERIAVYLSRTGPGEYRGFDHGSETHFDVRPDGLLAQLYDHGAASWFAYSAHPAGF
jgi:hypothetical protein